MKKVNSKTGVVTYYLQAVGAAIVHPDYREVIPLCSEMITRQDGETKNDCERNAIRRMLAKLRREHTSKAHCQRGCVKLKCPPY